MPKGYTGTKTDEKDRDTWRTPSQVFASLNAEFMFTCDVAASDQNHLVVPYLTAEKDALNPHTLWGAVNWCNPPYSDVMPWVRRAFDEKLRGNTTVMLLPADTSTQWFRLAWDSCNDVRLITGRLSFIHNSSGKPVSGNNKGSVIFIWRGNAPCSVKSIIMQDRDSLDVGQICARSLDG